MELSNLIFRSDTTDLERVSKVIGGLVTDISKLDKASRDAAKTEATLAKAAKDHADANLQNAKAQDVRLKSTITADKADQQAATAIEKKTKATERATVAAKRNVDMLQLQNDTYDFILEGFSKGDAKVLAMAKATGQLSDQLKQVLTDIRQFSKNTFDQTETGLDRMVKSAKEASAAQGFLNQGFNLTAKQAKELGNDLDRLNIRLQHQGKSYDEIVKAQAVYKQQFLEESKAVNQANNALATVEKQRKDVVSATNYMTQAEAKIAAALNTSNAALDKAGTDSLVKYETALRKSGVSQDVATAKLAKYKVQLAQVQEQEQKRREQHLTRAIAPQASDVVVSLWSGQNPLTVLLQQGAQVSDLFMQSGVAAENFGEVVKKSMKSMLPSILTVVKGVGGLLVDGFVAAGNAVSGFLAASVGMTGALDKLYMKLSEDGPSKWGGAIRGLSSLLTGVFATGVAVVTVGVIALGVAAVKAAKEQRELTSALVMQGASLGLTSDSAIDLAKSLDIAGVTTSDTIAVITEMAKVGNLGKDSIAMITEAAVNLNKWGGVAIADTVKTFSSIGKDPVEAMIKFAKETGLLTAEQIKLVDSLVKTEGKAAGVKEAMKIMGEAHGNAVQRMKDEAGLLVNIWVGFLDVLGKVKSAIMNVGRTGFTEGDIATSQALLDATTKELEAYAKISGTESGGYKGALARYKALTEKLEKQIRLRDANAPSTTTQTEQNSREANELERTIRLSNDLDDKLKSLSRTRVTQAEYVNAYIAKLREQGKVEGELYEKAKKVAELEWQRDQKSGSKSENYYATLMREATNNTIAANTATQELTKSEQKLLEVKADPRFAKLTTTQQADVIAKYDAAIAAERQTAMTEKLAEAEEHRLKLLGKSEGIGKQYYADMQKLEEFAKVAGWSREEIEELTRAVFKSTPVWKAYEKALEDVNTAARKFNEDIITSQEKTAGENRELDHRLDLLGRTTEEQKLLSIEYQRANKIREVDVRLAKQLRDIEAEIAKAKKKGLAQSDYQDLLDSQVQMQQAAAEEIRAINRETAVIYAEDLDKEIRAIKSGITDSIVTALFEGGKAGSSKLRNVVVEALKKPVTIAVNAVVNTLLGGVMNSFTTSMMSGGGGLLGGISGLSGLVSTANNLYSAITGGFANLSGSIATQVQSGLNFLTGSGGMISQGPIQVGGLAQGIGSVAAPLLGAYGGISAGRLIGGGYSLNGGSGNSTINLGTAIGSLFGPLGGLAGGAIGGGINRLFGRKLKESGIEGTFGGETGFDGRSYQYYKGGLFRSNKTKYGELDEETRSNFAKSFFDMKSGVTEMAKILGVGAESLEDFTYKFKVNLKGLSEEEATKAIQEQFKLMGEEMTKLVLNTDKYSLAEETRMDTLVRLSATLSTVNTIFENMGMTMYELGLTGADAAYELTQLFGGLDKFTSVLSNYYEKFYSDSERQILLQSQLDRAFKDLGVSVPKTREEFRSLVEVQDLTTERGRKIFTELMKLVDGFDVLASQAEQLAEEIASAAEEARKNAIGAAYSALETAVNAQKEILKVQESAQTAVVNNLKATFDLLKKNVRDLYMQVDSTAGMLASQGRAVIQQALSSGSLPDAEVLGEAITAVRSSIDSTAYVTQFEQDKARLQLAADLKSLQDQAGEQLSTAELILKGIKDQIEYLDALLASARKQVDAALGIQTAVLSVADAITALTEAIKPPATTNTKAPVQVAGGGAGFGPGMEADPVKSKYSQVTALGTAGVGYIPITDQNYISKLDSLSGIYHSYDGTGNLTGLLTDIKNAGGTLNDLSALSGYFPADWRAAAEAIGIQAFADGGVFSNSVVNKPTMFNASLMGEAGPEAIMPLTNVNGKLGVVATSSGSDSQLVARVADLEIALQVIATNTSKTTRLLERVTRDGESLITKDYTLA